MLRVSLLAAILALQGCAPLPSGSGGSTAQPASFARQTFQVDEALRAFEQGCLSPAPSVEAAQAVAEREGIVFASGRRGGSETNLRFNGDPASYACRISMRGEWNSVVLPFVRSALSRQGFTLTSGFTQSELLVLTSRNPDNLRSTATASRNGRQFVINLSQQASNRNRRSNRAVITISGTSLSIVTADRVR